MTGKAMGLGFGLVFLATSAAQGTVYYVDRASPTLTPTGTSWPTAFRFLQDALDAAAPGDTVLVSSGVFYPDKDMPWLPPPIHVLGDRNESFVLKDGVSVLGGFAGAANPDNPDERNPVLFESILDGDIGDFGVNTDNSFHVVQGGDSTVQTLLDGFTIRNGYGYGETGPRANNGAGIYLDTDNKPTIQN